MTQIWNPVPTETNVWNNVEVSANAWDNASVNSNLWELQSEILYVVPIYWNEGYCDELAPDWNAVAVSTNNWVTQG